MITISVAEQNGLERSLEYVQADITLGQILGPIGNLVAVGPDGVVVPVQSTDTIKNENGFFLRIVFPVAIKPNEIKKFSIEHNEEVRDSLLSDLHFSKTDHFVENKYYKANFGTGQDKRGGQVLNLILKNFNNQLLHRNHKTPIHWAPNFSRSDSKRYYTMEFLSQSSKNELKGTGPYTITKTRSGETDSIPEIHVEGEYIFYAGLPYFEFTSTITVIEDVKLKLLRNDEMTMDSLFTDLIFAKPDNSIVNLGLYKEEFDILEEEHITDDSPWLAFYNKDKGYGFGSIRLDYENTNVNGEESPLHKPYTKISKSVGNGRYWNRILIADTILAVPAGSRYYERNAYFIFNADSERAEDEALYYSERLNHPLVVTVDKYY
ncbi:hypothetical protein MWU78_16035 [Arenibacter sp. F26102]|uniref:hypothetical protein n=1 Tax=Arenibacter sp. F26102 TaxID=2926416 RepID=UPI001FF376D7|nr:hypothetical protein [Arenibacter sp. F26102]MCK0147168.1 hypothetical protein [Arenibacter sp. F26102]